MTTLDAEPDCTGTCRTCPSVGSCESRVVCRCLNVTEHQIIESIRTAGVRNLRELRQVSEAGSGCTCCHRELSAYLKVYASQGELVSV